MSSAVETMAEESPIDAARPIVDAHHHLWDIGDIPGLPPIPPFLVNDVADLIRSSGHNITHTVFLECRAMYRQDGPEELKVVGETEFVNGMAAMSASGRYGPAKIAAGIVGAADLRLGTRVVPVLQAHIAAGGGRFRGIRVTAAYSDRGIFGGPPDLEARDLLREDSFREGAMMVGALGLTLDIWCLHPQLGDLAALARACPDTVIVLDHIGTPLDRSEDSFGQWREGIERLAELPNTIVKISGLGMDIQSTFGTVSPRKSSARLADEWRRYVETCVASFGPSRSMLASNFPPDGATSSYGALWNAFKIIADQYSDDERDRLFRGTAAQVYRLPGA